MGRILNLYLNTSHLRKGVGDLGFPGGSVGQQAKCNAGDTGDADSVPGLGRSPGVGTGNPLQYSCLGNPMDRGAWWATVQGVTKTQTQLSAHIHHRRF